MNDELKEKANWLMYRMTKAMAEVGFSHFLEVNGVTPEEWKEIKQHIKDNTGIGKFYV